MNVLNSMSSADLGSNDCLHRQTFVINTLRAVINTSSNNISESKLVKSRFKIGFLLCILAVFVWIGKNMVNGLTSH